MTQQNIKKQPSEFARSIDSSVVDNIGKNLILISIFDSDTLKFKVNVLNYKNNNQDVLNAVDFITNSKILPSETDSERMRQMKSNTDIVPYTKTLIEYFKVATSEYKQNLKLLIKECGYDLENDFFANIPYFDGAVNRGSVFILCKKEKENYFTESILKELVDDFTSSYRATINPYYSIPHFEEFGEILHDRLHGLLYQIENMKGKFSIVLNLLDRSPDIVKENEETLLYAGVDIQRKIIEKRTGKIKDNNKNWNFLKKRITTEQMQKFATYKSLKEFRRGKLTLKDIKVEQLKDYFGEYRDEFQNNEREILDNHFNLNEDYFISLPIIAFGTFDGVAHIVFTQKDKGIFERQNNIIRIIKLFIREFEAMILNWDVAFDNIDKLSEIKTKQLEYDNFYVNNNPILQELGLGKYYQISRTYFEKRLEISDRVPTEFQKKQNQIRKQHLQNAIISILIDSFAHNISTHSLITLSRSFQIRADYVAAINTQNTVEIERYETIEPNPLVLHKKYLKTQPLSHELSKIFGFLSEKATFWNAITRYSNFVGQNFSLFEVFWKDFITNSLYLGTIATSEKIKKIHINITVFDSKTQEDQQNNYRTKNRIKVKNGKKLNGKFATINFDDFYNSTTISSDGCFIERGDLFNVFKDELSDYIAFFPYGLVGKHSLLTIIENEIRNVKHYKGKSLGEIRRDGLTVNISIQKTHINSEKDNTGKAPKLFKIGVWLKHSTTVSSNILGQRMNNLNGDIIESETFRPRLGGNFQDKICAAMLFNNKFNSVQYQDTERDKRYYPWLKLAISTTKEATENIIDFEMSGRKFKEDEEAFHLAFQKFIIENGTDEVFYKKSFHLWIADDIYRVKGDEDFNEENLNRFKFLIAPQSKYDKFKKLGIVRLLIKEDSKHIETIEDAYLEWLKLSSKNSDTVAFEFFEGINDNDDSTTKVGRIEWDNERVTFVNKQRIEDIEVEDELEELYQVYESIDNKTNITIAHGGKKSTLPHIANYRSYGALLRAFCQNEQMAVTQDIEPILLYQLYEFLSTKICAFDDRMAARIHKEKREQFFTSKLNCTLLEEDKEVWENYKNQFFNYHFLIIHLSFLENYLDENGQKYQESGILRFIDEQILRGRAIEDVEKNFKIVITTGRGRSEWWDRTKDTEYARIVTLRPIESLLNAIDDALQIQDDIDVKYNLTKVLFGS